MAEKEKDPLMIFGILAGIVGSSVGYQIGLGFIGASALGILSAGLLYFVFKNEK